MFPLFQHLRMFLFQGSLGFWWFPFFFCPWGVLYTIVFYRWRSRSWTRLFVTLWVMLDLFVSLCFYESSFLLSHAVLLLPVLDTWWVSFPLFPGPGVHLVSSLFFSEFFPCGYLPRPTFIPWVFGPVYGLALYWLTLGLGVFWFISHNEFSDLFLVTGDVLSSLSASVDGFWSSWSLGWLSRLLYIVSLAGTELCYGVDSIGWLFWLGSGT